MKRSSKVIITSVGAALVAALTFPLMASSASAAVVETDGTAVTSSAVQGIHEGSLIGTPLPASVSITSAPSSWMRYAPMPMQLATTGFSDGNWVNVWVTNPDGVRHSQDGHFMRRDDNPVAFANFMAGPGAYKVQVSVGAWPEEQWSQIIDVTVD